MSNSCNPHYYMTEKKVVHIDWLNGGRHARGSVRDARFAQDLYPTRRTTVSSLYSAHSFTRYLYFKSDCSAN